MAKRAFLRPNLFIVALLLSPALLVYTPAAARADDEPKNAAEKTEQARPPKDDNDLKFWLENMLWYHRFTPDEVRAATGLAEAEVAAALKRFGIAAQNEHDPSSDSRLLVRPYPGGRHPRTGFRDGAINPQRDTKVSIFTPWDVASYVVADVPEAIWSNLGLTYLAHTHVPTIWTKQNIELEQLEWQRRSVFEPDDGKLFLERKLPGGIVFTSKVVPDKSAVWFEMSLTNGTSETLTDLRVQNCVMLAAAKGFEQQTNDNKVYAATKTPGSPYVAVRNAEGTRWITSAFEPLHRPWANPPCPCLHSDPKFPDCAPGQTRYVRGLVTFYEGKDIEAKFKELDEIGWRDRVPRESADAARQRKARVAERRAGTQIICHRGAVEFGHENTLEAYRATFELGADGNEIDIRETKDGVLVCFHDDMLDQILEAYWDVSDYTWNELRRFRFRRPGRFGKHTRIPTLAEAFALHRQHAGLIHLDIKRPGLDHKIAQLLDAFDLWDHVIIAPAEHGAAIVKDPRFKPLKYKTQLYTDHGDVDPREIEKALKLDGTALIVDDPRACIVAARRRIGSVSTLPVVQKKSPADQSLPYATPPRKYDPDVSVDQLLEDIRDFPVRRLPAHDSLSRLTLFDEFWRSLAVVEELVRRDARSDPVYRALERVIDDRLLINEWQYHGLDGALALRGLFKLQAPRAVDVARECLWRDDPALDKVRDPKFNNPRSWHDWRIKNIVFPLLATLPGEKTEKLCRDYLALSDDEARRIGPPHFDAAARTLLTISPNETTALELLKHRHPAARNRTIKVCLQSADQPWALAALTKSAPHALNYIPPKQPTTTAP
jgi:hypothetical protein